MTLSSNYSDVINMLCPLVGSVINLHSLGYVHGKIRPSNILVDVETQRSVLFNFEMAVPLEQNETCLYTGKSMYEPRAMTLRDGDPFRDIYALGVIVFRVMSC